MSLLLESIRIEEGKIMNFDYHCERMVRSAIEAGYRPAASFPGRFIPEGSVPPSGLFRCRVLYGAEIIGCSVTPYYRKEIGSLRIVHTPRPDYSLKYADRSQIDALFGLRGVCDDILIVSEGMVTDTSYCNVAFERDGRWVTPAAPLLKGTMRQYLLDEGIVEEGEISLSDYMSCSAIRLFNAMVPWERAWHLPVSALEAK
ncbi:MAG: aminotransferase class IV [Bacteroidales bacterium]|jgi:4-amino-4-deoxychorismate lyase|nr:aminotransferase class IV [Bacteroidales bacterium]